MTIDIIIPTYKPDRLFLATMDALMKQTVKPGKIIIVNTEVKFFDELMPEDVFLEKYDTGVIFHVDESDFDHGKTRNFAASHVTADSFVMMTQDAVPADDYLLENLISAMTETKKAAVCYARQLPTAESDELERFIRSFNYGTEPLTKTQADVGRLGIKAYFCSNVCAIYSREIFEKLGGFANRTIFNEDMIYAAKAIHSGYTVRYEPLAMVTHAHNYNYRQQFKRNFDIGVSHAEYTEVFSGLATESEGIRMMRKAMLHLLKKGKPWLIFKLFWQSMAKYRGFRLGKRYNSLTEAQIHKYTANLNYWNYTR
jgi:rhamnosyltransferase